MFPLPVLYSGDFNCPHVNWGYNSNSANGECLVAWASLNGLVPLHDPKDMATFHSGRWNTGTNPDLAFVSVGPDSRLPDRRILEKFPRSQHRPSLIVPPRLTLSVPSMPAKRWNFHKAKWSHCNALTNQLAKSLLPLDTSDVDRTYQNFCNAISTATKKYIPRGRRNGDIPCWDAECYWHIYPPITRKRQSAVRARLGVAGHLSTTPRWGNPVKCLSQQHNK